MTATEAVRCFGKQPTPAFKSTASMMQLSIGLPAAILASAIGRTVVSECEVDCGEGVYGGDE